jgi:hypothetical protein
LLGPSVPSLEIEVVLGRSAGGIRLKSAVVVVELNPNCVEVYGTVKHGAIGEVGIRALGSGCYVVFLGGISCEITTQFVGEGGHVADLRLKIEVKSVNHCISEGPLGGGIRNWTKGLPDLLGPGNGCCFTGKTPFSVGCSSE